MKTKFYICPICGNIITKIKDSKVTPVCCGQTMQELVANTVDASAEKHLPVFERVDKCTLRVKVGSEPHPMALEHHIRWIYLETQNGGQLRYLPPEAPAVAEFCICKDKPTAIFAYCNIHGLWVNTDLQE